MEDPMNNRVKQLRETLNMSQEQFGKSIGLTKSSISNIEKSVRNVTEKHIKLICSSFNVNENWLRNGSGEMFNKITNDYFDKIAKFYNLDDLDKRIIYEYSQLSESKRAVIKDYILSITGNNETASTKEENHLLKESDYDSEIEQQLKDYRKNLQLEHKKNYEKLIQKKNFRNA
jgi:transcriptional regulator with XRE-family HTH domain